MSRTPSRPVSWPVRSGDTVISVGDDRLPDGGGECPVLATARIVSGKWTLLVLRDLAGRPCRFTELERSLTGISPRTLSQRLKTLEAGGIIAAGVCHAALTRGADGL